MDSGTTPKVEMPEGQNLSEWANARIARYDTRTYDWDALKFQADFDPKYRRTQMRSQVRKVEEAIAAGDQSAANDALKAAQPEIMRCSQKGILHKNTASRKVSRLAQRVKALSA